MATADHIWAAYALAVAFLLAASTPAWAGHDGDPIEDPEFAFEWNAPNNATGAFLTRARVDFPGGGANECEVTMTAGFRLGDDRALYRLAAVRSGGGYQAHSVTLKDTFVQAHVEGVVDTRDWERIDIGIQVLSSYRGTWTDHIELRQAAFNAQHFEHASKDWGPMSLNITCADPARLTVHQVGRHVHGFTAESGEGGAGATVHESTVNVADGIQDRFGNDSVLMQAVSMAGYPGAAVPTVTLDHPNGTEVWPGVDAGFYDLNDDVAFEGPPGAYDLRVTRAGAAPGSPAGFNDVFAAVIGDVEDRVRNGSIEDPSPVVGVDGP